MKPIVLCLAAAVSLAGCTEEREPIACAAYAAAGLSVSVTNADTGQPICDATVTATEGAYSEKLFAVGCTYTGAYERAGTYVVRASRDGFTPKDVASVKVVMGGGDCPHVQETRVTVSLAAAVGLVPARLAQGRRWNLRVQGSDFDETESFRP